MKLKNLLIAASACCLFAGLTHATPISYDAGTVHLTQQVTDRSTGINLHGTEVTACFVSGQCQTVSFDGNLGGATFGAANGDGWSLSLQGDSFFNPFIFTTDIAVTQLHLNGAPGATVFDTKTGSAMSGSPGALRGKPFAVSHIFHHAVDFAPISVLYSNLVLVDHVAYGDLYSSMTLNFASTGETGTMTFYTDTDQATLVAVPLPATFMLLFTGLVALRLRRSAR